MNISDVHKVRLRELIIERLGVDEPCELSPLVISDFYENLDASDLNNDEEYYDVDLPLFTEIEEHVPQYNDGMSGAIAAFGSRLRQVNDSAIRAEINSNCSTVCWNRLEDLIEHMPDLLLNIDTIPDYRIFEYSWSVHRLPADFVTTVRGLARSLEEVTDRAEQYSDEDLVLALMRRGGYIPVDEQGFSADVVYPEDMVPFADASDRDRVYWRDIWRLRKDWAKGTYENSIYGDWKVDYKDEDEDEDLEVKVDRGGDEGEILDENDQSSEEEVFVVLPPDWNSA